MTPATAHTPPSDRRIAPPESPWQTALAVADDVVCSVSAVTPVIVVTPARSVEVTPASESLPHPARIAFSPTRASRLTSSGTGGRPITSGIRPTAASHAVLFASRQDGWGANDCEICCGPDPRKTLTAAVAAGRQWAAVRIAFGAITVPEHEPICWPPLSFMFNRTTAEPAVEHSAPLTIAVAPETAGPTTPQAVDSGIVGADGEAGVDEPSPPPQAPARTSSTRAAQAPARRMATAPAPSLVLVVRIRQGGQRRPGPRREHAGLHIREQLVAGVDDVEVAHGELADAVLRGEHRFPLLHGQALGLVGQVRRRRVHDRVVVAAAQLDRDLAGDRARDPALRRLAQHHRLRIEPAPLVEEAAEPPAVVAVLLDGVFVVDAGNQPLVGDEQEREAGRLVDAAALRFDDPVLDLVAHAEAVAAADPVGLHQH